MPGMTGYQSSPVQLYCSFKESELVTAALASKPIEVAALGRPLYPGMLYDCRSDTFIPGVTLWDRNSLREDLDTHSQHKTDFDFSSSDSLSSKASLLDVSASLKASFLSGLVEVEGSAKFLRDTKSSNQQSRVTMYYSETTRFDQLTMTHLGKITYPQVFDQKTATHVVTGVLYGAKAFMVFDRRFSEEENKQEIEGKLSVMVKSIPGFSIEGQGALEMTDSDKKMAESIACTFHGDFRLGQNPTTFTEAIDAFKKLPTILKQNPENAVPIKVWLYPLSLLNEKAAKLEREITARLVSNIEDLMEELGGVERTYNDLSRKTVVNVFGDIKERLQSFQNSFSIYKSMLLKEVARVLPAIRGGEMGENSLEDIQKIHYSSPFKADMLNQWSVGVKSEIDLLSTHINMLDGVTTEDSDRLNNIFLNLNVDVVVCLTFTSLKYEDPYISALKEFLKSDKFKVLDGEQNMVSVASVTKWFNDPAVISKMRETLNLFKSSSEANKDEKRYRFIMSAISDPSSPGSSIRLYEKGKLTDTQFQPVSKPPPPEVKDVQKRSVSLKLQKSPTGETVQYRVEYRQVKEEQWHAINTPDEDFTLSLEFGRQYLIRYRIVGRVGVSEASNIITPMPSSDADPETRNDFLDYSIRLNLDLNTVHRNFHLSEDNRYIACTSPVQSYPDHPDRFDYYGQALCRDSVSGRSYWEIEWNGNYVFIAVSYKSICRKGGSNLCTFGGNDHSWSLFCSLGKYSFMHNNIMTVLPVKPITSTYNKVGVYVNPSAGTLSFYSISGDSMNLIHSVQATFTQPLYAGFRVDPGSSVKLL
ncbi:neoverrucotoxin subunit alpha-like [Pseudorasbora parva]|uniref:neoverrucotoxin subunit alpha-like n=1 Tax=Pseudorasbora parva TaxID=51549 RepID=UPI00351F0BCA